MAGASSIRRFVGSNAPSLHGSYQPVLGYPCVGSVDLAGTTGHNYAWLVGYASPLTLVLGSGQVLLVDVTHAAGELLGQVPSPGPMATFSMPIPSDPSFAGLEVFTQALHFGGVQPVALSNALDLFLGY